MRPTHRQWIYSRRPDATVGAEHYLLQEAPLDDALGAGEVLIETRYFSVDPYMRIGQSARPTYDAEPHPPGVVQRGGVVAQLLASAARGLAPGDWVSSYSGWQTHARIGDAELTAIFTGEHRGKLLVRALMKKIIANVMLTLALAPTVAVAANPSIGSHGMVLFGGHDALYASHLPMFHAPHDYQVILQLRLADRVQDRALRARLDGGAELWTLDPEKFALDAFAPTADKPVRRFSANLVQGHFEQGGVTRHADAGVIVEKVLYFRQLSASTARSAAARYMQLGTGRQRYLVKKVDSRPDFDHIVAVRAQPGVRGGAVVLAKTALEQPSSAAIVQALPGLTVTGTVYFSTADLR